MGKSSSKSVSYNSKKPNSCLHVSEPMNVHVQLQDGRKIITLKVERWMEDKWCW